MATDEPPPVKMGSPDAYRSMSAERTKVDTQRREHMASIEKQILTLKNRVKELENNTEHQVQDSETLSVKSKRKLVPRRG